MIILWIYVLFAHASALPSETSRHRYDTTEKSIEDLKSDMEKIVTKLPINMRDEIMGSSKKEKAGGYFDVLSKNPDSTYIIGNKDKKRYRVRIKPKTKNKGDSSSSVSGSQEYNSSYYTPSSKTRHVKYKGSDENNKNIIRTSSHGFRQINKGDHSSNDDGSRSYEFGSENQKKDKARNNHSHEYEREIKKYKIKNKARLNQSYGINEEYSTGIKKIKKKKKKNFGTHTKEYIIADKVIKKIKNNGNSEQQHSVDFNEHSGIDSDQLISSNNDKDRFTDEEFDYEFDTDHVIKNKPGFVSNPNAALSSEKRIHKKKINKKIPKIKKGRTIKKQRIVSVEDDDEDNENFEIINDHEIVSHSEKGRDKNKKMKHVLNTDQLINNYGKPISRTKPSIESISDEFTSNSKETPKSKRKKIKTQQRVISLNDDANGNFEIKTDRFIDNDAEKNKIKSEKINNGNNIEELVTIDGGHKILTDPILVYNSHEIIPKSKEIAKINKAGLRTKQREVIDNHDANFDTNNEQIIPSAIKLDNNANKKYRIDHDELKVSNDDKINNGNENHVIDTNKFISNNEEETKKILSNQKENFANNSTQPDKYDENRSENNGSNNSPSIFADVEDDENEKINFGFIPDQHLNNSDGLSSDTKLNFELIADDPTIIKEEIEKDTEENEGMNNKQRLEGDSGNAKEIYEINTKQLRTNDDNIKDDIDFVFDADQLENNDTDIDNEVTKILDIIYKQIEAEKGNYSINIDQPEISDNDDNQDKNEKENFELNTDLPINKDTGLNNHGHNESKVNSDEPVDSDKDDNDTREYAANVNQSIVGNNDNANGSYEINTEQPIDNNNTIRSNGDELLEGDKESNNYTKDNIELETDQLILTDNENDRNTSVVSKVKIDEFLGDNDIVNGSNGSTEQPVVNDGDEANVNLAVDTDPFTEISNIENNDNTTEKIEINTDQDILKDSDINITRNGNESRIIHIDQLIPSTNGTDNSTNASLEVNTDITDKPIDRNDIYTKLDNQTDETYVPNVIANQLLDELLDIDDLDKKYITTGNYDVTTDQSRLDTREATDPVHISTKMPILRSKDDDNSINSKNIKPITRTQEKKHEESNDKDILSICKDLKLKPQDIWLLGNKYFGLDITKPDHLERFKQLYVDFIANLRNDTEKEYLTTVSSVVDLLGKDKDADLAFTESMRSVDDVTPNPILNIDDDQSGITVSDSKGLEKLSGAVKEGLNVLDQLINSYHDANEPKLFENEDSLPNVFQLDPPVIVPEHEQSNPSRDVLKAASKQSGSKQHNLVTDSEVLDTFGIQPTTISDVEQKITPNIDKLWDLFLKVQNARDKNIIKPVSECDSDCESVEEQSKGDNDLKPILKQYPAYAVAIAEADKLSKDLMRNPELYEKTLPEQVIIDKYKKTQLLSADGYREIPTTKQEEVTLEPVTDSQQFTTNPFVISPVTVHQVEPQRTNLEDPKPNNVDPQYDFEGVQPFKNSLQRPKNETSQNNNPYYDKELSDILDFLAPQPIKYERPTTSDDWLTAEPTLASKVNQHPTRTHDKALSEIKEKLDSINIDPLWLDKLNAFGWPNVENFTNRETTSPSVTPSQSETGYTEINQPTQSMVSKTRNTIGENYYEDKFQSTTIVNTIGRFTPAYTIINNNIIKDKLIDTYNDPNVQEDDDLSIIQDEYKPITYKNDENEKNTRKELDPYLQRYEKQRYPTTIADSTLVTLIQTKKIQKPLDKEYERASKSLFKQKNKKPEPKWQTVQRDRNKIKPKLSNYEQIYDYNIFGPIIDEEPPMSDILEKQGNDLSKLVDIIIYVMNHSKSSALNQKLLKLLYHILVEESKAPMHGKKVSTLSDEKVKKLRKYYVTVLSLINTYSEPLTGEQERLQQDYVQPTNVNYQDLTRLKLQSENSMNGLDTEESDDMNNRKIDPQIVKYKDRPVSPTEQRSYPKPDERPNLPYILDRNPEIRYNNKYSTPKIQIKSKADFDGSLKGYGNAFNSEKLPHLDNDSSEEQKEYILKRSNLMKLLKKMNYPDEFINKNVDKLLAILEKKRQNKIYRNNDNNQLKIMGLNRPIQEENTAALQDKNPKNVIVKLQLKNQKPNIPIRKIIKALPPETKNEVDRYVILPAFSESPLPTSVSKEEQDEFDKIYLLQYPEVIEGEDAIYGVPPSSSPGSTMDNLFYNINVNPDNHQDLRIWSTKESSENFKQNFINKPSKPDTTIEPKFKKPENKDKDQLFIGYTYEESDELPENVYNFARPPNSQQPYINPPKSKIIQWQPAETVNKIHLDSKPPQKIDFNFVSDLENKFNAPPIQTPNNIDDQTQFYLSTVNLIPDLLPNSYNTSETDLTPEGILAVPKVDFNRIYYNLVSGILRDEMTKVYQFLILNEIPMPTILNTLEKIKLSMIMSMKVNGECLDDDVNIFIEKLKSVVEQQVLVPLKSDSSPLSKY